MMDWLQENPRERATARRRHPGHRARVRVPFEDGCVVRPMEELPPGELQLEVADEFGHIADWMTDSWWMELVREWSADQITIRVEAGYGAALNEVTLRCMEMLRRLGVRWHLVGEVRAQEIGGAEQVERIAQSPYHEVHIIGSSDAGGVCTWASGEAVVSQGKSRTLKSDAGVTGLLERIRAVQAAVGRRTPILSAC